MLKEHFQQKSHVHHARWTHLHHISMPQKLALGVLAVILLGALLLMLPMSSHHTGNATFVNALFTATSAATITGLTVVDTPTYWTTFGQLIIMILMELGALSFMSFSLLLFVVARRRIDLQNKLLLQETYGLQNLSDTRSVFRYVILFSGVLQLIGAALLAPTFVRDAGWARGLFNAVFHSVSAFANAGFSTLPRQLGEYQQNPVVLLTIAFLVLAGSLGFMVWRDILLWRSKTKMSLHTKLTLWSTGIVMALSVILLPLLNYDKLFIHNDWLDNISHALFMATSYRVGGFQPFDTSLLSAASILFIIFLMFVGGSAGSTAGGLKTTTLAVLVLQLNAALHGQRDVNFAGRRLSQENIRRALILFFVMLSFVMMISFVLLMTETGKAPYGQEYIIFEVVSALSNNGLSLGLTSELSGFGKVVIMTTMFLGRVGIYTAMFALLNVHDRGTSYRRPEETVIIG